MTTKGLPLKNELCGPRKACHLNLIRWQYCGTQGITREQFEGLKPDFARMHAASTDGAVFAVAVTVPADDDGARVRMARCWSDAMRGMRVLPREGSSICRV